MAANTNIPDESPNTLQGFPDILAELPDHIGRYHILEQIGEGGMGNVYRAEQRDGIRRTVAVKIIKLGMDTKQVIARFESERQALALMSHPNVAKVFDAGTTETGRPYFVMEYVAGEPIHQFCDRHQFSTQQRLRLFLQACHAVQHAHQKAIIHRDLKPSNILVTLEDGQPLVKVIDFGVAKATAQKLTERTLFTETGHLIGTPEYMSPEQAEMNALDVDTRSDIYSLGVVLYEILTGALPFDPGTLRGAGFAEIQRIIREVEPPRPSARLSSLSASISQVVAQKRQTQLGQLQSELRGELEWIPLKAMRKDRAQRYATAAEMGQDIENYLEHLPLLAGPESAAYRFRKFLRRNKVPVAAAFAVITTLLLGITATTVALIGQARARAEAERQRNEVAVANANSVAVIEFLTRDVLGSADPAVTRGRNLGVKEALDNAAKSVGDQFKDRPLVEAAIRHALATTYQSLGRADLGLPQARTALAVNRRTLGDDDPATLGASSTMARLLAEDGKLAEAEVVLRDTLTRRRRILGNAHPDTLESIDNLGHVLKDQGRLADAEPLLQEALKSRREVHGNEHPATISSLQNLGLLLRAEGKLAEARALFREALEASRQSLGNDHPETLTAVNNMGFLLQAEGALAEAEPLLREAMDGRRRVLGENHVNTLISMNNYAALLLAEQKLEEAEPIFRDALEKSQIILGEDHPYTLSFMMNVGNVLRDKGALPDAEDIYRVTRQRRDQVLGSEHPETLAAVEALGAVLITRRSFDEAASLLNEALKVSRRTLGPDHHQTLRLMAQVGDLLMEQGRHNEAEPLLADLYLRASQVQLSPRIAATCMARWGQCLTALGRFADAEAPLVEAQRRLIAAGLKHDPQMKKVVAALEAAFDQTGRGEMAGSLAGGKPTTQTPATSPILAADPDAK